MDGDYFIFLQSNIYNNCEQEAHVKPLPSDVEKGEFIASVHQPYDSEIPNDDFKECWFCATAKSYFNDYKVEKETPARKRQMLI